jgi:hypothetical protein
VSVWGLCRNFKTAETTGLDLGAAKEAKEGEEAKAQALSDDEAQDLGKWFVEVGPPSRNGHLRVLARADVGWGWGGDRRSLPR